MRRSAALSGLSRDHHRALVVARELCRARPEDAELLARRFVEFLAGHELDHFELEESILLPALEDEPGAERLVQLTREQHARLREAARSMRSGAAAADLGALHETGALLRDHVRMEERELFPLLEERLQPAALEGLGRRLREAEER